jgi:lycopene cyclase domain-containing protein
MTYWAFHLVFILPVIGVLLYVTRRQPFSPLPHFRSAVALIAVMALLYTTPWDNYLIYRGVWSYNLHRISESLRIGYVPLEEYCFFLLQPVLTGLYLLYFAGRSASAVELGLQPAERHWAPRVAGGAACLVATLLGWIAFLTGGPWTYLGLIFLWAGPVLAFHWLYAGDQLWHMRRLLVASVVAATVYLWVVDRIALEWKIWSISPVFSTGWNLLGLPMEEAVFFLVTNLLVVQGMILFFAFVSRRAAVAAV